jgi:membrane associated rhomboid family serine protease
MVPSPLRSRAARSTEGSAAVDRDSSASPRWGRIRVPVATVALWIITALVTTPQILLPAVGELLRRDPIAVSTGQWWRLLTPLLVHPEGWLQVAFDFSSLLIVGAIAERLWGSSRLWLVYLVSGFSGEVAGYAWAPRERRVFRRDRAGLLGGLLMWMTLRPSRLPHRIGGIIGLVGAAALTLHRDLHGPPLARRCWAGRHLSGSSTSAR